MESTLLLCPQFEAVPLQPNRKVVVVAWLQPEVPRTNKLSTESPESGQVLAGFTRKMPDNGGRECSPTMSIKAIEAKRCSYEHLVESEEVAQELVFPALIEDGQSFWLAERQPMSWIISKTEMRRELDSLAPSVILTPLATLPASSPPALFFSQLGNELVRFRSKPLDYGGPKQYPYDTISLSLTSSVEQYSPMLFKMNLPPVYKPNDVWAGDTSRPSSPELVWWECAKPSNMTISTRQYLYDIVSAIVTRSATRHPPQAKTGFVPVLEPNLALACCLSKRLSSAMYLDDCRTEPVYAEGNQPDGA